MGSQRTTRHTMKPAEKAASMKNIADKYIAIWTAHYSKTQFGGTSLEAAAVYAAMDCMNVGKRNSWSEAEYIDDIEYWTGKLAK